MALIMSYQVAPPGSLACNVDAPVSGGTVSQIIDLTNHLALGRARRCVHSNLTRQLPLNYADLDAKTDVYIRDTQAPGSSEVIEVPWLSSATAEHLILYIRCRASGSTPSIIADLYELNTSGGAHAQIDKGCHWTTTNRQIGELTEREGQSLRYRLFELSTGATVQAASGAVDDPRPLVIPPASRGLELMVRFTCASVSIAAVDMMERFEESWS